MLWQATKRRQLVRRLIRPAWLGTLRRTTPLSDYWGIDRGLPVDRYYIERFLDQHRQDIRGRVLEVKDNAYTLRFGTGVRQSDVLDIDARNPQATLVADLAAADSIPSETFDCFILTQTLQRIYDVEAAVAHTYRILRPGGVLLATLPALCRVEHSHADTDYWRFTQASGEMLFRKVFGTSPVSVQTFGNVLSAIAFLTGMAFEELSRRELDAYDPYYPIVVAIRAVKPADQEI
jgi:SAM-dependent methyltransferase